MTAIERLNEVKYALSLTQTIGQGLGAIAEHYNNDQRSASFAEPLPKTAAQLVLSLQRLAQNRSDL